jgi:hypothetical protein
MEHQVYPQLQVQMELLVQREQVVLMVHQEYLQLQVHQDLRERQVLMEHQD